MLNSNKKRGQIMQRIWTALCAGVILGASMPSSGEFAASPEQHKKVILIAEGASPLEVLAAREIRRYLYGASSRWDSGRDHGRHNRRKKGAPRRAHCGWSGR
jgi:hypothetical protein